MLVRSPPPPSAPVGSRGFIMKNNDSRFSLLWKIANSRNVCASLSSTTSTTVDSYNTRSYKQLVVYCSRYFAGDQTTPPTAVAVFLFFALNSFSLLLLVATQTKIELNLKPQRITGTTTTRYYVLLQLASLLLV